MDDVDDVGGALELVADDGENSSYPVIGGGDHVPRMNIITVIVVHCVTHVRNLLYVVTNLLPLLRLLSSA